MDGTNSGVTMHIGELAEQTGLSTRTIRHYDDVGLLHPTSRSDGGFRLYTPDDLDRLMIIRRMKPLGFALEEMADVLGVIDRINAASNRAARTVIQAELDEYIADTRLRRDKLRRNLGWADEFLAILEHP